MGGGVAAVEQHVDGGDTRVVGCHGEEFATAHRERRGVERVLHRLKRWIRAPHEHPGIAHVIDTHALPPFIAPSDAVPQLPFALTE